MRLSSIIEFFIPAPLRADPLRARDARLVVAICLVGALLLPPFALRHLLVTHNLVAGLFTLALGVGGLIVPILLRSGASVGILVQGLAATIWLGTFAISISRGGFVIAPIIAILFIPLVLGLLRMRRAAAVWGVLVIIHYGALASISQLGVFGLNPTTAYDAPQLIAFAVLMTAITLTYDANRESLQQQNAELQRHVAQTQRAEAIGQLASGVAHDFNNLLTVVRTAADAMLAELPANHPLHPDVRAVSDAADRGASITRQLTHFANARASEEAPFDVAVTLTQMLPILQRLATKRNVVSYTPPTERCIVVGDARQFEHAVLNLVANARDAMPAGGEITLRVELTDLQGDASLDAGPYVVISVRDVGNGISEAALPHIFEPFFTTKTRGTGTGLGLSTSYGTVRAMGGDIRVSTSTSGTTFEIVLPRSGAPISARPAAPPRPSNPSVPEIRRSRGLVLVVDDQPLVVSTTSRMLTHEGYEVVEADGPLCALDILAQRGEFDVMLTDVMMPEMSGHALAERARALHPKMPIVYMSGHSEDASVTREVEGGLARFVRKPFSRDALVTELDGALGTAKVPAKSLA